MEAPKYVRALLPTVGFVQRFKRNSQIYTQIKYNKLRLNKIEFQEKHRKIKIIS